MSGCRVRAGLILATLCFHARPAYSQEAPQVERRVSVFHRLRHLDEQFRRFQEATLTHLSEIASNYNISYNIDTRFQELTEQYRNISGILKEFQAVTANDLNSLKFWTKKLQKKTKKLDLKVVALEKAVQEEGKLLRKESQEQQRTLANLTQELHVHKEQISAIMADREQFLSSLRVLQDSIKKQENRMSILEKQLRRSHPGDILQSVGSPGHGSSLTSSSTPPGTPPWKLQDHRSPHATAKLQAKHSKGRTSQAGQAPPTFTQAPPTFTQAGPGTPEAELQDLPQLPLKHKIPQLQHAPKKRGTICNVKSMLLFPSTSIRNYVTFRQGFSSGIHELSMCTWLKVEANYMGTLLSYATEDNDNKLVLYGRNSGHLSSIDFVIGDPTYRELPVEGILGGDWHHLCIIWSAAEGRFWQYVDRRLISIGSRFQKGYEIPPGGSLVLGQEQDSVGGGFDEEEAFVGQVAGFALWNRALSPGEVSGIATGKGLPREPIITLDDVDQLNGSVQLVECGCLEYCT